MNLIVLSAIPAQQDGRLDIHIDGVELLIAARWQDRGHFVTNYRRSLAMYDREHDFLVMQEPFVALTSDIAVTFKPAAIVARFLIIGWMVVVARDMTLLPARRFLFAQSGSLAKEDGNLLVTDRGFEHNTVPHVTISRVNTHLKHTLGFKARHITTSTT